MFVNLSEAMNNRLQEGRKHRYAVGMVGMVTVTWGMPLCRKVAEWDPNLILDVNSAGNVELQRQLSSGLLDMAFGTDDMHLPHVPNSFTVKYRIGWIARPDVAGDDQPAAHPGGAARDAADPVSADLAALAAGAGTAGGKPVAAECAPQRQFAGGDLRDDPAGLRRGAGGDRGLEAELEAARWSRYRRPSRWRRSISAAST